MALVFTLVTAGFNFDFLIHAGGFWRDEVNLLNTANQNSLAALAHDSFPVLMPLLVKSWCAVGLGGTDLNLRLLGLFISLGGLAALWLAAWRARRTPPLISLVLFALNSTVITYGGELRPYGLGSLMIVLLFTAAIYFLQRPDWRRAGIFSLLAVLSVQSLFHNAVLVGAICLGAIVVGGYNKNLSAAVKVFAGGLLAAVSLLPYAPQFLVGRETDAVLRTGFSWSRFLGELETAVGFPWAQCAWLWALLTLVAVVLAVRAFFKKSPPTNSAVDLADVDVRVFAGATSLFALGGFLGFLQLTALPGQPWYFMPLMVLLAVVFDTTLAPVPAKAKILIPLLALATFLVSLPVTKRDLNYRFTNLDHWAAVLTEEVKPGDYTIISPWFTGITFAHYFRGTTAWNTLPPLADHTAHRYDLMQAQMKTTNAIAPVLEKISTVLRAGGRVWLLCPADFVKSSLSASAPPPDLPAPPLPQTGWLDEPYSVTWTTQTVYFLAQHGQSFRQINPSANSQRIGENSGLFVIAGWRDTITPPKPNAK